MITALITSTLAAWAACALAVILAIHLLLRLRVCRGSTLSAPCIWAIISTTSLAAVLATEMLSPAQTIARDALRFAAAVSTFCPTMAILGAKRPQDRGWQWIVLSLWAIAVWPAVQAALLPTGTQVELFIVWKFFLLGLVAVGLLNYLPTRFALAALFVAVAQLVLLSRYLWNWNYISHDMNLPLTILLFNVSAALTSITAKQRAQEQKTVDPASLAFYEQQWLSFRNAYGAFWALRILARVNETAELRYWPLRLTCAGFVPHPHDTDKTLSDSQLAELEQTLSTLLRRFNKQPVDQSS